LANKQQQSSSQPPSDEELEINEQELQYQQTKQHPAPSPGAGAGGANSTVPLTGYFYNPGAPTTPTSNVYEVPKTTFIPQHNYAGPKSQQQQKKIPIPGQQQHQQQQEILDPRQYESGIRSASIEHARLLYNSRKFSFRTVELPIRDEYSGSNVIAYSVGEYLVQPDSQTKWVAYNVNALYQVVYGEPWFLIGDEGKTIPLGHYIVVPKATRHCIYNKSVNIECKVHIIFPGEIGIKENP
jgi:mannose-6-phosphate isomerase-like protein (cupin superfamily)